MTTAFLRPLRHAAGLALLAGLLAGCDASTPAEAPDLTSNAATASAQDRGGSPLDGNPILTLSEADFFSKTYVDQVMAALGADGATVVQAANANLNTQSFLELKDALPGTTLSEHLIVEGVSGERADGPWQNEVVLGLVPYTDDFNGCDLSHTYVILDPSRFYPSNEVGGDEQWPFELPAVPLAGGTAVTVSAKEDGVEHPTDPQAQFLVLTTVGVAKDGAPDGSTEGSSGEGGDRSLTRYWLGIKGMQIHSTLDGGSSEVYLHRQPTDNYASEFSRTANVRLNRDFFLQNPVHGGAGGLYTTNFINDGWFYAYAFEPPDVNNANQWYSFSSTKRYEYLGPFGWTLGTATSAMPVAPLVTGQTPYRLVGIEDDFSNMTFERFWSGGWSGPVQTYNIQTGTVSTLTTKLDASFRVVGPSDEVFNVSGLRRATLQYVNSWTGNGTGSINATMGGFKYELSRYDLTGP